VKKELAVFVHSFELLGFFVGSESMGAQIAKNGAKDETVAEKSSEAGAKSNGQENGHAKTNGNASPTADAAAEAPQANGKHSTDEELKADDGVMEKSASEGDAQSAPAANGENSTKSEEDGSASGNAEPAKQKKRFSFKKPFKLGGFSFKKNAKKEPEGEQTATPAEEGKEEAAEGTSEEVKPEASAEGEKEEAPQELKPDEASGDEKKPTEEVAEEKAAEVEELTPAEGAEAKPTATE
uniref:Myristoylated alanine-rich C-kinase substrate n=3 Tax=Electrophorus TaxID=8004 RepID=A0A4W4FTX8_ELEEL